MKLGKLARGLGKVGLLIEGVAYVVAAGKALAKLVRGDPAARRDDGVQQDRLADSERANGNQPEKAP